MNTPPEKNKLPFVMETSENETIIKFIEIEVPEGMIPLKAVLRSFISFFTIGKLGLPPKLLYMILGKLRSLFYLIQCFNDGIKKALETPYFLKYIKCQILQLLSVFGYQLGKSTELVHVHGLEELITAVEGLFVKELESYHQLIKQGIIVFDGLQELYKPGTIVVGSTNVGGEESGFKVIHGFFEERRTLFGTEKSFHLQLEFIASVGDCFTVVSFEEVLSGWMGERTRSLSSLPYAPADHQILERLIQRGKHYETCHGKTAKFLCFAHGTFFVHGKTHASLSGTTPGSVGPAGRIIIDTARGMSLGHHPSQGSDEPTHAMIQLAGRYKRFQNDIQSGSSKSSSPDSLILFDQLPEELVPLTWPALVGSSLAHKAWGHVLVRGLSPIQFNDKAFDQLVLDADRKQLIRALVKYGNSSFEDIIEGKSGGSIFLLHGPPGVGKTLTAEAIAEVLHKPLYYVTMGELGTSTDELEKRLSDILKLCGSWDSLVLIDEADVFLEKRDSSDVVRNAMVCVMLRLLEYHQGILFLTTNRVTEFDPAFESRVTVALKYESLGSSARIKVWQNLIKNLPIHTEMIDFEVLGNQELNGRQIKNCIRLALALAEDQGVCLNQQLIEKTLQITSLGRSEMATAKEY